MKKILLSASVVIILLSTLVFAGCGTSDEDVSKMVDTYVAKYAEQLKGEDGLQGGQGIQGVQGEVGPKGDTGDAGADGATGPQGEQGIQGEQGPAGLAGYPGTTGVAGPDGAPGFPPAPLYDVNLRTTGVSTATLSTVQSFTGIFSAYLKTDGVIGTGRSGTIVLTPLSPMTLAQLNSVSWQEYLIAGYPPHLDVTVDLAGGGTDTLVFEYAYNSDSHYIAEAPMPYGALTGAWYATFSDDGNGPVAVTDTTFAWLNSGAAGPYPPSGGAFIGGNLADWKSGTVDATISGASTIVKIEIEIDNWVVESEAYVDDIVVNGSPVYWIP